MFTIATLALWGTGVARAATTLQVAISADPVVGQPASITASGSADASSAGDLLDVFLDTAGTCASSIYSEQARSSSLSVIDSSVAEGPFSQSSQWTPSDPAPLVACAYVSISDAATPDAFSEAPFNPRLPHASVAVALPSDVGAAAAFSIGVVGSAEVGAFLSVYLEVFGDYCSATPSEEASSGGQAVLKNSAIGVGSFSDSLDINRPYPVSIRLCAYVTGPGGDPLYATSGSFLRVRPTSGIVGGRGTVTPSGRIGSLRIDRSDVADVLRFAGVPDVLEYDLNSDAGISSDYTTIKYGCDAKGNNCRTEYDVNQDTGTLADFITTSQRFATVHGTRVGMRSRNAVNREHRAATGGCFVGIFEGRGGVSLLVEIDGGHSGRHGDRWTGGRVGDLFASSVRNDVLGC